MKKVLKYKTPGKYSCKGVELANNNILLTVTNAQDEKGYLIIKDFENKKTLRMISTDGKRLSKVDYLFKEDINIPEIEKIIIPKKALNEVNKFLETAGSVQIGVKDNHFIIKKDN